MRIKYIKWACVAATAMLWTCARQDIVAISEAGDGVVAVLENPECGDGAQTRALSNDFKFSFAQDDKVNVFAKGNYETYMTYSLAPDEKNGSSADFQTENFSIRDGEYVSLYPSQNATSSESVTLSFTGQNQTANNSANHLAAYDYSWAQASITDSKGEFQYSHKVAWLKITIATPKNETFKSISVRADEGVAGSATINLTDGTVTPDRKAGDVLTMTLNGDAGIEVSKDGTLTAFIAIPAGTYTNMQVEVTNAAEIPCLYEVAGDAKIIQEGYYYTANINVSDNLFLNNATCFGVYDRVFSSGTDAPTPVKVVENDTEWQITNGSSSSYTEFKILNLLNNDYVIIKLLDVTPSAIAVGEAYSASVNVNGTVTTPTLTVVKKTADKVWLENMSGTQGYIIRI